MKTIVLSPIKENSSDFEEIEEAIIELLKKELYIPLIQEIGGEKDLVSNSSDELISAIRSGKIFYRSGQFKGRFNATLSRELRRYGAVWDKRQGSFLISQPKLPKSIRYAISASEEAYEKTVKKIDQKLNKLNPEIIADKLSIGKLFDSVLWKINDQIKDTVKGVTTMPKLTREQADRLSSEYQNNMKIYIKDFTQKEIKKLRGEIIEKTLNGNRYESMVKKIQDSYGVTRSKAKFLARQETNLAMAKYKESKYTESGIDSYIWRCVVGSPKHPVRHMHKALDGKEFKWSNPPVVNENGDRKNPMEDFNCRCTARPVVRF